MHVRHINVVVDDQTLNHPHHLPPQARRGPHRHPLCPGRVQVVFQHFDPVLQILASLRSVRNNYVTLTNVPPPHRWTRTDNLRMSATTATTTTTTTILTMSFQIPTTIPGVRACLFAPFQIGTLRRELCQGSDHRLHLRHGR